MVEYVAFPGVTIDDDYFHTKCFPKAPGDLRQSCLSHRQFESISGLVATQAINQPMKKRIGKWLTLTTYQFSFSLFKNFNTQLEIEEERSLKNTKSPVPHVPTKAFLTVPLLGKGNLVRQSL